ncbi:MAG: dihydroneopterin aldolase family protein [Methanobacterium sp.]|uniref:dihydroneopterin aldolase family protein n=1 Tax=Methanobacterium sp. TaxID=2164 RepID=UPI003D65EE84|nr:dihydroneopterin aldolase family protein [Methanobacterium sp.]
MDVDSKYFKNISSRERVIFEGAITMGALFHQFVGTPVTVESAATLEKSIKHAMELQPCIMEVEVKIDREMLEDSKSEFDYVSLSGEMMNIKVVSKYNDKRAVLRMEFIEELNYPLMYVEKVD